MSRVFQTADPRAVYTVKRHRGMRSSPAGTETREIDRLADLDPYRSAWNDLAAAGVTPTVYQTFEWITSWWRCFGRGRRLAAESVLSTAGKLVLMP